MVAQELFTVSLESNPLEFWDDEGTAGALRALVVPLHSTGISLRETAAVLEQFSVNRSHQAVFQWVHRTAEDPPRPATDFAVAGGCRLTVSGRLTFSAARIWV